MVAAMATTSATTNAVRRRRGISAPSSAPPRCRRFQGGGRTWTVRLSRVCAPVAAIYGS
jgi:hypothetical protein